LDETFIPSQANSLKLVFNRLQPKDQVVALGVLKAE